jgi:hypothetical protein
LQAIDSLFILVAEPPFVRRSHGAGGALVWVLKLSGLPPSVPHTSHPRCLPLFPAETPSSRGRGFLNIISSVAVQRNLVALPQYRKWRDDSTKKILGDVEHTDHSAVLAEFQIPNVSKFVAGSGSSWSPRATAALEQRYSVFSGESFTFGPDRSG